MSLKEWPLSYSSIYWKQPDFGTIPKPLIYSSTAHRPSSDTAFPFFKFQRRKSRCHFLRSRVGFDPGSGHCLLDCFLIVLYSTGYVSLASTGATLTVIITTWILYCCGIEDVTHVGWYLIAKPTLTLTVLYSVLSLLILFKHIKNYKRLIQGTESNFKKKKALEPKH